MYIPSLNEFSSLNYEQKIQIVENIQNIIEAQRKNYLKNNNNEILISSYYPTNIELNNINTTDQDSFSSSSSNLSDDNETINENDLIEKAKNNIINIKKDYDTIQSQYYFYKSDNEKNMNKIKETIPDQEINYIIETTNFSNNDSFNDYNNYKENTKHNTNYKNNIALNFFDTFRNYQQTNFSKEKENKKNKKELFNNKNLKNRINNTPYNITCSISSNKNKNLFQTKSMRNYTKSNPNIFNYDTNKYENSNEMEKIKKKLNFNKISKNKKSKSLMKIICKTQRKNMNKQEISDRLYNMHKIIKEKINKKKQEIDEEEMKNCSFMPKINDKSRQIVKKIEKKKESKGKIYKKINICKFLNKN